MVIMQIYGAYDQSVVKCQRSVTYKMEDSSKLQFKPITIHCKNKFAILPNYLVTTIV